MPPDHQFEVVEARRHHVGQIVRRMRVAQRQAFLSLGLGDPHRELSTVYETSGFRRAWMADGRLAALGGVCGSMISPDGFVWLVFAEEATNHPRQIVLEVIRQLKVLLETYRELTTNILPADEKSWRFAEFLGFRPVRRLPSGVVLFSLTKDRPISDEAPFVVFALPRSRTKWLSEFLSPPGWTCTHDLPIEAGSLEDIYWALDGGTSGSVETGLTRAALSIRERFPQSRFVVVRRPVHEVVASATPFGWVFPEGYLEAEEKRLAAISEMPNTVTVDFRDLQTEVTCRKVFEHCIGRPMAAAWWAALRDQNIQIDMDARLAALGNNHGRMTALFDEIDQKVTIQTECFEAFYRDGKKLFDEHYEEAGSFADLKLDPSIEFASAMEKAGFLQIVTARTHAEMVGYIVFLINPCFESREVLLGFQNIFFVTKKRRGRLGLRLHAFARAQLKKRGVSALILRSGVRSDGPRQEKLFVRLGAIPMGKLYYLKMEG